MGRWCLSDQVLTTLRLDFLLLLLLLLLLILPSLDAPPRHPHARRCCALWATSGKRWPRRGGC